MESIIAHTILKRPSYELFVEMGELGFEYTNFKEMDEGGFHYDFYNKEIKLLLVLEKTIKKFDTWIIKIINRGEKIDFDVCELEGLWIDELGRINCFNERDIIKLVKKLVELRQNNNDLNGDSVSTSEMKRIL
jgi:hypothetical protein